MAEGTILQKFVSLIQTKVDPKSVQQTQATLKGIKSFAVKTLGAVGIGLSLSWLKDITEEFKSVNDEIRGATEGLAEQSEIQKAILKSANSCKESYKDMAEYVTGLVSNSTKIFPVEDATKFAALVSKLEKASGKSGNTKATMTTMNKIASAGKADKSSFAALSPEVVKVLEQSLGKSKKQLESMAAAGTLTASKIKDAFFSAEDDIQKKFDKLDLTITDATKHIRNSWGFWLEDLDSTFKVTDKIARFMIDMSDKLMSKAQKITDWLKHLGDKLEGTDKVLKLIAFSAAAIFLAMNAQKITAFLLTAVNFLKSFNIQTALAAAKWLLLFLVLEDIWTFFQGGDSIFGRLLKDAGVDVDAFREKVFEFFNNAKRVAKEVINAIGQFWKDHQKEVQAVFDFVWQVLVILIQYIIGRFQALFKIISGLLKGFQTGDFSDFLAGIQELWDNALNTLKALADLIFSARPKPLQDAFQSVWDWLKGFFDWFGDKIQWAKDLWNGAKNLWNKVTGTDDPDNNSDKDNKGTGNSKKSANPAAPNSKTSFSGMGGGVATTKTGTGRVGLKDFVAGGQAVSGKAAAASRANNTTNNTTIKQENNQQYTFNVSERETADKLQREVYAQGNNSAIQISTALNYGR